MVMALVLLTASLTKHALDSRPEAPGSSPGRVKLKLSAVMFDCVIWPWILKYLGARGEQAEWQTDGPRTRDDEWK